MPFRKFTGRAGRRKAAFGRARKARTSRLAMRRIARAAVSKAVETKTFCQSIAANGVGTSGHIYNACGIAQGDGSDQRIGDKATLKSLNVRGYMEAESADVTNTLRFMVVKGKSGLDQSQISTSDFPSVYACVTPDMRDKYTVLFDKVYTLKCSWDGTNTVQEQRPINWKFNLRNARIRFNPGAATVAGGGVYIYAVSNSSVVSHPDIEYATELRFQG